MSHKRLCKRCFIVLLLTVGALSVKAQAVKIDTAGRAAEAQRWNDALLKDTGYHYNKKPNAFLVKCVTGLKPGKAVDIAMGQGRNAIYLAKHGWDVTGFDIADSVLAFANVQAQRLHVPLKTVRQGSEEFNFDTARWDLVSMIYAGCLEETPELARRIKRGLKLGGMFVFEFFHRDAGVQDNRFDFGCPANLERQILEKIGGFKIIIYEEVEDISDYGLEKSKLVRLCAIRI